MIMVREGTGRLTTERITGTVSKGMEDFVTGWGKARATHRVLLVVCSLGLGLLSGSPIVEWREAQRFEDFLSLHGEISDFGELNKAAEGAKRLGETKICLDLYSWGIQRFPGHAGVLYFYLGSSLVDLGMLDLAIEAFRNAVEDARGLNVSFGFLSLADAHERSGDLAAAWSVYEELMAHEAAMPEHVAAAAAFAHRHSLKEAELCFEDAMRRGELAGGKSEAGVLRRLALLKEGGEALVLYERLTMGDYSEAGDYQRAGRWAAEMKLEDRCRSFFAAGLAKHDQQAGWLHYEFGKVLKELGQQEQALEQFEWAKDEPSGLAKSFAYHGLASMLQEMGRMEEARGVYEELLGSGVAIAEHIAEAGAFEAAEANREEAFALYLRAYREGVDDDARISVGNVLFRSVSDLGGVDSVTDWFRTATESFSEEERVRVRSALATTWGNYAWDLLNSGKFSEAATAAEAALVINDPNVLVWVEGNRAHAYLFLGRLEEARAIHQRYRL
ncbi:MAG: hypothetical protein AAF191_18400, partial [Verrucomicrobiota bacterium]